jgi:hypothetical protein
MIDNNMGGESAACRHSHYISYYDSFQQGFSVTYIFWQLLSGIQRILRIYWVDRCTEYIFLLRDSYTGDADHSTSRKAGLACLILAGGSLSYEILKSKDFVLTVVSRYCIIAIK